MKKILITLLMITGSWVIHAEDEIKIKITPDLPYLDVRHNGKTVRIMRIQDPEHRLSNSYAKTSRPCPPFCVHPIKLTDTVQTVGVLELLNFLDNQVKKGKGALIDARLPQWYEKGTIPGSVNIPFPILTAGTENPHTVRILKLLGGNKSKDGSWNFEKARELMLYCNGLWCGQSTRAIMALIKIGYPEAKLYWYRGGMQDWQLLGLTTVVP
jgi:rhodanese-related sulfurtransferase